MSQTARPGFKSKLPRPVTVTHPRIVNKRCKESDSKPNASLLEVSKKPGIAVVPHDTKSTSNGPVDFTCQIRSDNLACERLQIKNDLSSEDQFQADPKALESILSNRGVTADLFSNRQSTVQSASRSSIYYESPSSRMSMIDSHSLFKERMKRLKDQMKSLNMKHGGPPTKSEKEKTTPATSSTSCGSIYYQIKPLHRKPSTPDRTTPVASRLEHSSLSERKQVEPKNTNSFRLCNTVSKLNTKTVCPSSASATGKENKRCVKFKLFSSPIHEVSENTPPLGDAAQSSQASVVSSLNSYSKSISQLKMLTTETSPVFTAPEKDSSSLVSSLSKDLVPVFELESSTAIPINNNHSSSTLHNAGDRPTVMSAMTSSTWTIKDSICTPKSKICFTPIKEITNIDAPPVTPALQTASNCKLKEISAISQANTNTPTRILCSKNESSLHKPPQRIMKSTQGMKTNYTPKRL